jgi:Phosphoribosylamine-glycine ligase
VQDAWHSHRDLRTLPRGGAGQGLCARRPRAGRGPKADGLAAGKGVVVAANVAEAEAAIDMMFGGALGEAGGEIVVEEFLDGEEASFFALCDGETAIALASAQDHKRAGDGDTGPNTGGMGAYSPAPIVDAATSARVMETIVLPTLRAMKAMGAPYKGVLFAGLMLTAAGPQLIEYNVRFGDPECQVLMLRLMSDLVPALLASRDGVLKSLDLRWFPQAALTVVMAAKGYPGPMQKARSSKASTRPPPSRAWKSSTPAPRQKAAASSRTAAGCSISRRSGRPCARPVARLRGHLPHPLAGRLLSPRHRLAGS